MLVYTNASSLILRLKLVDDANDPVTGIAFDDVDLQMSYLLEASDTWVSPTLVSGTAGTFLANSWVEIGSGIYQWCPPNAVVVQGSTTLIRATYSSYQAQYDTIESRLLTATELSTLIVSVSDNIQQAQDGIGTGYSNAQWTFNISDLVALTGRTDIVFALKRRASDPDSKALLLVSEANGLTVQYGNSSPTGSDASITVNTETSPADVTLVVSSSVMQTIPAGKFLDGWKMLHPDNDLVLRAGTTIIREPIVDAVTE